MTRTFQKCVAMEISRVRRRFFVDAGAHAGRVLSDAELDALDQLDDAEALDMALPTLTPDRAYRAPLGPPPLRPRPRPSLLKRFWYPLVTT